MSTKAATTVSISPSATAFFNWSKVRLPAMRYSILRNV
jgi:hypothetical protein